MSATTIDLNADLGEGCPWDLALLERVRSASVCCGAHAGGADTSRATLVAARARGVVVGAHPGYPDRENFGRVEHHTNADEVEHLIRVQVAWLRELAVQAGTTVRFLKPHGALYNQGQRIPEVARGIVDAAGGLGLPVLGLPGGEVERFALDRGVRFIAEGFADRGYGDDGRLIPRGEPGALLDSPEAVAEQVARLVDRGVATLCLHGDDPRALGLADLVRNALDRLGVTVRSFVN